MSAATVAFHVSPDDAFDDWIVRDDGGRELGHYPTREAAELVAQDFARKHGGTVVIHLPDGRSESKSFKKRLAGPLAHKMN
jgi:Uncharacterized protein conserved in bacteria (DUF2188)